MITAVPRARDCGAPLNNSGPGAAPDRAWHARAREGRASEFPAGVGNRSSSPSNLAIPTMSVVVQPKQLNPLLAAYLQSLAKRPVLTKSCTSGLLSFISETVAGNIAGSPAPRLAKADRTGILPLDLIKQHHKAIKLALYGFFISAPLGHTLLAILQKAFAGKTSARAKVAMIVCSNLFVSPIQQSVYISAMAVINGATSPAAIFKAWKMSILPVMRFTWVISTLSMAVAQKFLAPELWVPFFTTVGITAGTFINVAAKKKAIAAKAREQAKADADASVAASEEEKKEQ